MRFKTNDEAVDAAFRLQMVWMGMHGRCNLSSQRGFDIYGRRGIKLCKQWSGRQGMIRFVKWALAHGWRRGLVIDRRNGRQGYSPANCRCITQQENTWNKVNNRRLTYMGERKCAAAWGHDRRCKVPSAQFQQRITAGWSIVRALTTPLRSNYGKRKR